MVAALSLLLAAGDICEHCVQIADPSFIPAAGALDAVTRAEFLFATAADAWFAQGLVREMVGSCSRASCWDGCARASARWSGRASPATCTTAPSSRWWRSRCKGPYVLKERVRTLGGELTIATSAGGGSRGFQVVGQATDGREAVRLAQDLRPDVLLLDVAMPRASGLDTLRELSVLQAGPKVLLLTVAIEDAQTVEALQLGARGVVLKEAARAEVAAYATSRGLANHTKP